MMTCHEGHRVASFAARTNLPSPTTRDISAALNSLLADLFAVYVKAKNFHWHASGSGLRDYRFLLDEQGAQILGVIDPVAERVLNLGGTTLHSISHIARLQRILDNDASYLEPPAMLKELREDNLELAARMREAHQLCEDHGDTASASLLETLIDEAEKRACFLFEAGRPAEEEQS